MNNKDKNVQSGSKANPFFQTEVKKYNYLSELVDKAPPGKGKMFKVLNINPRKSFKDTENKKPKIKVTEIV